MEYGTITLISFLKYFIKTKHSGFSCGDKDIDEFFTKEIPNPKRRSLYPAVLVGQLGINHPFQGKYIGNEALDFIKAWFIDPMNKTGCRYIIVDAINHPKVIDFYKRNGFSLLFDTDEDEWLSLHGSQSINEDGSIPKIRTRLMYFNLMVLKK